MKALDVVEELRKRLPEYTSLFNETQAISSLTATGGLATATLAVANTVISTGDKINITGALVGNPISSLTQVDGIGTGVCSNVHDLTEGFQETITIAGATESAYNGTFTLLTVEDENTFTFTISDSAPATATGSPVLEEDVVNDFNGHHEITVIDTTHFTFSINNTNTITAIGSPILDYNFRIHGTGEEDRIDDTYTKQGVSKFYLFVDTQGTSSNQNRSINIDSAYYYGEGQDYDQLVYQGINLHVKVNCKDTLMARSIKDSMEDLMIMLFRSLVSLSPSNNLTEDESYGITFDRHDTLSYQKAIYTHLFQFQQVYTITDQDIATPEKSVAFRNIELNYKKDNGDALKTDTVELP